MQPVDEDELANTQQGPEEAGSQNSVPLSQRETQPWRLDVAGDRDGAAFRPPVGLESGCAGLRCCLHTTNACAF